jgi:hypothetical protein
MFLFFISEKIGMESLLRNDVLQFISLGDQEVTLIHLLFLHQRLQEIIFFSFLIIYSILKITDAAADPMNCIFSNSLLEEISRDPAAVSFVVTSAVGSYVITPNLYQCDPSTNSYVNYGGMASSSESIISSYYPPPSPLLLLRLGLNSTHWLVIVGIIAFVKLSSQHLRFNHLLGLVVKVLSTTRIC